MRNILTNKYTTPILLLLFLNLGAIGFIIFLKASLKSNENIKNPPIASSNYSDIQKSDNSDLPEKVLVTKVDNLLSKKEVPSIKKSTNEMKSDAKKEENTSEIIPSKTETKQNTISNKKPFVIRGYFANTQNIKNISDSNS